MKWSIKTNRQNQCLYFFIFQRNISVLLNSSQVFLSSFLACLLSFLSLFPTAFFFFLHFDPSIDCFKWNVVFWKILWCLLSVRQPGAPLPRLCFGPSSDHASLAHLPQAWASSRWHRPCLGWEVLARLRTLLKGSAALKQSKSLQGQWHVCCKCLFLTLTYSLWFVLTVTTCKCVHVQTNRA